jgi:hypothetical protein
MIRSFAAAGVANHVIAVHDNDTAAADGLRKLRVEELPERMRVLSYPDIELAIDYPTLGPPTNVSPEVTIGSANINGQAASIEIYLGRDVLQGDDGNLAPVQWTSYIGPLKRYQGEVVGKREIQERFRRKYADAIADLSIIETQDWSGIKLILDSLLTCFHDLTLR